MHHQKLHSARTPIHCSCVTSSNFDGNDELVAVEVSRDVGNVAFKHIRPVANEIVSKGTLLYSGGGDCFHTLLNKTPHIPHHVNVPHHHTENLV